MVCDSAGNLYVADNSIGNLHQGSIYRYKPDGSRVALAVLSLSDRPSDLALDTMGNLLMADLGGKVYKYYLYSPLRRQGRTIFGSVPNSARSLACDSANNLFVVDAGDVNGSGNAIYKFTTQAVRAPFAPSVLGESFSCLAVQPMACCEGNYAISTATPTPRPRPTPAPRPGAATGPRRLTIRGHRPTPGTAARSSRQSLTAALSDSRAATLPERGGFFVPSIDVIEIEPFGPRASRNLSAPSAFFRVTSRQLLRITSVNGLK